MTNVAYVRVSAVDQNTDRQDFDGVKIDKTFTDKASGGSRKRPALERLSEYVREGDTVHVHSIDRLARDLKGLLDLIQAFNDGGVTIKFHKENLTFTGEDNPMQKMMLHIMGAVAEFERSIIRERQAEGIAKAKAAGVYKGGKRRINAKQVVSMHNDGVSPTAIAKKLGIARSSVYRALEQGAAA